jgi:putative membrane protein
MVNDHGKANEELKTLAAAEGVTLPTQLDSKHTKELQRLQKLVGPEFDREYMKLMLEDHKKDIKAFQHEAQKGDDPEVKGFAQRTLPTLRAHLSMVEQTLSALGERRGQPADSAARTDPATGRPAPTNQ